MSRQHGSQPQEKVVGILQPSYLPWLGYFEQMNRSDVFVHYDDTQYEKGSWRNRNRIKTPGGPQWLTVPVITKGKGAQLLTEVRINNATPWADKHVKTIRQHYAKAQYFERYAEPLFEMLGRRWELLLDLNMSVLSWLQSELGIRTECVLSSELGIEGASTQRLIRILRHFGATEFYEGSAGRNYIDDSEFEREEIRVRYQDYEHPVYDQLHGDFTPYLSVLDLLMNHGPESLSILSSTDSATKDTA
ncbi:WbqC family protein [Desulfohalovibrio reitneri]|uniref:WbqC family protein n=1 Tax=Desulfohalovibrio reitneri TaxID=1307759 RepID=UPI00068B7419|nr:WbqC family protein [Desulfohalovibrio reitneri]